MERQSSSLNFGIGLFETMKVVDGELQLLDAHMSRLFTSIDALNIEWTLSKEDLINKLMTYIELNQLKSSALKVVINEPSTVVISHRPNPYNKDRYEKGFKLSISDVRRHSSNPLWQHKTTNYWLNKLVRNHLDASEEAVFLNESGALMEGTVSNVFLIKDGCVYTPALSCGLLPGIMRSQVIHYCEKVGIKVEESSLYVEDLLDAEAVFISNSLMGLMPVLECIGMPKNKHPLLDKLMEVHNGT